MSKVCYCDKCGREMEVGAEAYYYDEQYYCERCFDIKMDEVRAESRIVIEEDNCIGYDKNEGCYSDYGKEGGAL